MMMPRAMSDVCSAQRQEAKRFWMNKSLRTAMIVPWAEAFTAAFLSPVYPFFMQNLGLDAGDMGQLRVVQSVLLLVSAPICGFLLDTYGPFLGIALPASICSIGCALKAIANSLSTLYVANVFSGLSGAKTDMAVAHVSRHTEPSMRTLAVSATRIQLQVLTLIGTVCFTPLNAALTMLLPDEAFGMLRFRLLISFCTLGCGFGVIVLCFASSSLSYDAAATDPEGDVRLAEIGFLTGT